MTSTLRVISGEHKGKPIKAVPGTMTRPTTDKVKEAIFNIIGPYFNGGIALDLYGGSGSLGIEALSRGMERVIFVDQQKKAVDVIKDNVKRCNYEEKVEVYRNEASRALKALVKRDIQFSCIFLDPPYAKQQLQRDLTFIALNQLLRHDGMIMVEHDHNVVLPNIIESLQCARTETYGDTTISIYNRIDT